MADPPNLRLFVAVAVPRDQLQLVESRLRPVKRQLQGARWTPLDNQHVTLKFLGATARDRLDAVRAVCSSTALDLSVSMASLGRVGAFPSSRTVRVLWIGLADPAGLLVRAATALDEGLSPLGWEPEKRRFTPHLTLARFKVPARLGSLPELDLSDAAPFAVETLDLFLSRLHPTGARYELLEKFPLRSEETR